MTHNPGTSCRPAAADEYDAFLTMTYEHAADFLEPSLVVLGIDRHRFKELFRTVGSVFAVEYLGRVAGFLWIEPREDTLHLHALILKPEFRKKGLAREAIQWMEREHGSGLKCVEVGVHRSNTRARMICEKAGYSVARTLDDFDFHIMQKQMA